MYEVASSKSFAKNPDLLNELVGDKRFQNPCTLVNVRATKSDIN